MNELPTLTWIDDRNIEVSFRGHSKRFIHSTFKLKWNGTPLPSGREKATALMRALYTPGRGRERALRSMKKPTEKNPHAHHRGSVRRRPQ